MDVAEVRGKIKDVISHVADIPVAEIGDTTSLTKGLGLDSLSLLEIGVDVDYTFQLGLPDEQLKEIDCVQDAVDLVCRHLAARPAQTEVA